MAKNPLAAVPSSNTVPCRLPMAANALAEVGLDPSTWAVLTDSIFPSAKTPDGIMLAVRYCQARGLDIMKRPVHVVPMWSKALKREVETVWPGIAEVQITAARTGLWAGMEAPKFGPDKTRTFKGSVWENGDEVSGQVEVTYPEWVEVTVYRIVAGTRCPFSETVFWEETYARVKKTEMPNEMWQKRPRGQLLKCAKAASLRAAFPEEAGEYTAEEMAGKIIEADIVHSESVIDAPRPVKAAVPPTPSAERQPPIVPAATAAETTAIPKTAAEQDHAIDQTVRSNIAKLVERAVKSGAWGQAEDYARSRFSGEHLSLALSALEQAAARAIAAAQAEAA